MLFYTLLILTIVIPTIVSIFFFKKLDKPMKLFSQFLIFKSFSEIFFIITAWAGMNNLICVHFYTIIEVIFMSFFFNNFYPTLKWFFIGIIGFAVVYLFMYYNDFNILVRVIESIFLCMVITYSLIKERLENLSAILIGLLYYFGFGIILFSGLYLGSPFLMEMAKGHIILGVFCNALYTYGILDSAGYFSNEQIKIN